MNKKYFAISLEGLLKTLSAVDADEDVAFRVEDEFSSTVQVGDCMLGFVAHGIDAFRIIFNVENVDDGLVLTKKLEKSDGVSFAEYEDQLLAQYADFMEPGKITELPQEIGEEIERRLSGGDNMSKKVNLKTSFQRITYGAPGTGKSWGVEDLLKNIPDRVVRTTFHPDSDYSTFVGAYKPTMEKSDCDTIVQVSKIVKDQDGKESVQTELKAVRKDQIVYKFVEQTFTKAYVKAWQAQAAAIKAGKEPADPVYLVIEEINRGNCAQAFGDIFQLLDRENGYSKYPVKADEDLRRHLKEVFKDLDFGGAYPRVKSGEDLVLPNNLCIWATMNTSDQSLFPMDSAFKRRWDWEYKPIIDGHKDWFVTVENEKYDWWKFLEAINEKIYNLTDSEDKQLGYYFVKAGDDKIISTETFVGKVIFYLWNDVYKDYGIVEIFKGEQNGETADDKKNKGVPFRSFFDKTDPQGKKIDTKTLKNFFKAVGVEPEGKEKEAGA